MSDDFIVGPNGACPICYQEPCICNETDEQRRERQRLQKRRKAHAEGVQLPECPSCGAFAVAEGLMGKPCLKCGKLSADPPPTLENKR